MQTPDDQIIETSVGEEMKTSFLSYAMSVVVSRALPDVRDGLKPVHRRILFGMSKANLDPSKPHVKCARVVGDVMGKYHPHGDSAIYNSLVRMVQDFSLRLPLVDGHGNFGTQTDMAAASRYCVTGATRVRLGDGRTRTLTQISEDQGLLSWGEADLDLKVMGGRGQLTRAEKVFHSGEHPTLAVTLKNGSQLTGTHNHPVLTLVGTADGSEPPTLTWKRFDELAPGDYVVNLRTPALEQGGPLTQAEEDLALLFGSWVSDGFYTTRAGFNNTDEAWFTQVSDAYRRTVGDKFYTSSRLLPSGKRIHELDVQYLNELNASPLSSMCGIYSGEKHIPAWVWDQVPAVKRRFLQALFEGDGSILSAARDSLKISYSSKSERLIRDVHELLLEFGIASSVHNFAGRPHEWKVSISNVRDAQLFYTRIGFLTRKQAILGNVLDLLPSRGRGLSSDAVPYLTAWVRQLPSEVGVNARWLRRTNFDWFSAQDKDAELATRLPQAAQPVLDELLAGALYHYSPVASITDAGVQAVYSLRIDDVEHAFITNGIVSHNTECRMSKAALGMTDELDEDTVDFQPNYDGNEEEPRVLPSAFPNLLVNGAEGIAVGMATKMPAHNLNETIAACQHLLRHPDATVADLMEHIPAPDMPTGGYLLGLDGIKEAYETGRGKFRMRARAEVTDINARRKGIVITELPYQVAPEHIIAKVKELRDVKKLNGISNIVDLSDMKHGMRLIVECKTGFNPHAVLDEMYKLTPLEETFTVHNLALVGGQPQTLTLRDLVWHYTEHRRDVTRRRCEFRKRKAETQAHLLEGYLIALASIEEVVATIRGSRDTASARTKLMKQFVLSEVQTNAILEMPLRRLTNLEVNKIKADLAELQKQIKELVKLLGDDVAMRELICAELGAAAASYGSPRRSTLLGDAALIATAPAALEVPDDPCTVTLSTTGLIGRTTEAFKGTRGRHDGLTVTLETTARATIGALTSRGRLLFVPVVELPTMDAKSRGGAVSEFVPTEAGEKVLTLLSLGDDAPMVAVATKNGLVKRIAAADFGKKSGQEIITLKDGDELLFAVALSKTVTDTDELLFVTSDAQLLRTAASSVRPQGRTGAGMAGVKLGEGAHVVYFTTIPENAPVLVTTLTDGGSVKTTGFVDYPAKGRATAGVRCMRLLRGETAVLSAYAGPAIPVAIASTGALVKLPTELGKRDGPGIRIGDAALASLARTR